MERLDIVSFVFGSAVKSLWPQKISSRSENYSARSKLLLISDKDRDKNPVQKFRLSFCNCKSCVYSCDDLLSYNSSPRSSLIWFSLIHNMIILSRVYNEPIQLSSTGRALHRYRRGQGFEFRTSLNFFRLSFRKCKNWVYNCNYLFSYKCSNCRESDLLCDLPKVLTDKIQACGWVRVTRILCARLKNASWVFSLGDFVLESLPCAQRWWILNLFSAHT